MPEGSSVSDQTLKEAVDKFEQDGYAFIENFLTEEEVNALREETTRLVVEESMKDSTRQIFGNIYNAKSDYFVNSGNKVRYFFEKKSFDLETNELVVSEEQSLAKIGHALHSLNPVFKRITVSDKVKRVFKAIGYSEPTVLQSMLIFKNPKVGGEYTPHQDAAFLYTEPCRVAGIWFALDDATLENGCLQFIPGSHKKYPVYRRFVRSEEPMEDGSLLKWTAPVKKFNDEDFVPVPIKRGGLVLIDGLVVHKSCPNTSNFPRWTYTFHAYDNTKETVYHKDNWLQVTEGENTFLPIYDN